MDVARSTLVRRACLVAGATSDVSTNSLKVLCRWIVFLLLFSRLRQLGYFWRRVGGWQLTQNQIKMLKKTTMISTSKPYGRWIDPLDTYRPLVGFSFEEPKYCDEHDEDTHNGRDVVLWIVSDLWSWLCREGSHTHCTHCDWDRVW